MPKALLMESVFSFVAAVNSLWTPVQ